MGALSTDDEGRKMSDNLAAGIARAEILKQSLTLKASKPRDCEYLGGAEQCMSIWEIIPPPERLYVSMGTNGVRMFTANPEREHGGDVITYIQENVLNETLIQDRDLWRQSEETCERQFTKVQSELNEVLDQMERLLGVVKAAQGIVAEWITPQSETTNSDALHALVGILDNQDDDRVDDAAQAILTKHGRWT
jgi:hypothetical protein